MRLFSLFQFGLVPPHLSQPGSKVRFGFEWECKIQIERPGFPEAQVLESAVIQILFWCGFVSSLGILADVLSVILAGCNSKMIEKSGFIYVLFGFVIPF